MHPKAIKTIREHQGKRDYYLAIERRLIDGELQVAFRLPGSRALVAQADDMEEAEKSVREIAGLADKLASY